MARLVQVLNVEFYAFSDDAGVMRSCCSNHFWSKYKPMIVIELCLQFFFWKFDTIALYFGEANFQMVSLGTHCLDYDGFAGWGRGGNCWLGCEVEGNAEDVSIFHVEQPIFVELIGLAAQSSADDLFAQQLRAEGTNTQNMCDRIGVPSFGQHGNRYDATYLLSQSSLLPNGIHDFTQKFAIAEVLSLVTVSGSFYDFSLESFDFIGCHASEVIVQYLARLQLLAVDQ